MLLKFRLEIWRITDRMNYHLRFFLGFSSAYSSAYSDSSSSSSSQSSSSSSPSASSSSSSSSLSSSSSSLFCMGPSWSYSISLPSLSLLSRYFNPGILSKATLVQFFSLDTPVSSLLRFCSDFRPFKALMESREEMALSPMLNPVRFLQQFTMIFTSLSFSELLETSNSSNLSKVGKFSKEVRSHSAIDNPFRFLQLYSNFLISGVIFPICTSARSNYDTYEGFPPYCIFRLISANTFFASAIVIRWILGLD